MYIQITSHFSYTELYKEHLALLIIRYWFWSYLMQKWKER